MEKNTVHLRRLLGATFISVLTSLSATSPSQGAESRSFISKDDAIAAYQTRYGLNDVYEKRVDNRGNGFEPLYGTRNFRVVLNGVVYRGGGNNAYHRDSRRNNANPLPNDGLQNLCEEGFGQAVYLYSTRYNTAPHAVNCDSRLGGENTLQYLQVSPLASTKSAMKILALVHEKLVDPTDHSPVYLHCWNGWHASGYISALVLRQFCGFTADEAVDYWNANTDGNNGSSYEGIRKKIRAFSPDPNLQISEDLQSKVCPQP